MAPPSASEEPVSAQRGAKPPTVFDVTEVAVKAQEAAALMQRVERSITIDQPDIQAILPMLDTWRETIPSAAREAREILAATGSITNVEETRNAWLAIEKKVQNAVSELLTYARSLRAGIQDLDRVRLEWTESLRGFEDGAPEAASTRAREIIDRVNSLRARAIERRDETFVVQDAIAEIDLAIDRVLGETVEARVRLQRQLFTIDVEPLWTVLARDGVSIGLEPFRREWSSRMRALRTYLDDNEIRCYSHLVLTVCLVGLFLYLRRAATSWTPQQREDRKATLLLRRPIAAALGLSILLGSFIHVRSVIGFRMLIVPVTVVVVLRLAWVLLEGRAKLGLVLAAVFYVLEYVRGLLWNEPTTERVVLLLEAVAMGACLIVLMARSHRDPGKSHVWLWVRVLVLALLSIGAVCLVVGFFGLGRLLTYATVRLPLIIFGFLSTYYVLRSAVSIALHTVHVRRLHMVTNHSDLLYRKLTRVIGVAMVLVFVSWVLNVYAIRDPLLDALRRLFAASLTVGSLSLSLGESLTFVFAIWLSFQISKALRFLCSEEIFTRTHVPLGVRYAASAAIHYVVLTVGFLVAILAAGVDMTRFAILGGAVGIGVGFGLQNIVNNFVSGLILLFERPIQLGDRVEIDTISGEVRRIGIRSSTVRTFDGAEVVVPNSDLIANKLTNWTLTDRRRRLIVPVGVQYGTNPDKVLDLLVRVARDNKEVLKYPEPIALFRAHGESSLDFELRAWTERFDDWLRVHSDLTRAVNRALSEAGIEIPFPQRDLHLRSSEVPLAGRQHEGNEEGRPRRRVGSTGERPQDRSTRRPSSTAGKPPGGEDVVQNDSLRDRPSS